MYDLVIKNVIVIDGSNTPGQWGEVGVTGDMITCVAPHISQGGKVEVDGHGMVLSPGFIDSHTHDDTVVITAPEMLNKISQGVTTSIGGNCGISTACAIIGDTVFPPQNLLGGRQDFRYPTMASYCQAVNAAHPAINIATLVGHTVLRNNCMDSLYRPAKQPEIAAMRAQLRQALDGGALGLSTGLAYVSAVDSLPEESRELSLELAEDQALYVTHVRSEFDQSLEAVQEALDLGYKDGVPVHISHLKCAGIKNWEKTDIALEMLDQAVLRQDVSCDCYPYAAGSTILEPQQITADYPILVTWSEPHPEMGGKELSTIADMWDVALEDAAKRLSPAGAIYFSMDPEEVNHVLRHPLTMFGSDGLPLDPKPHPRLWGCFPRILGRCCREEGLFPLHTAIYKMSGQTAARFRLQQRGLVREGYFADMVLFDPKTVIDVADYTNPCRESLGIERVYVNGALTYQPGKPTGLRAGRFLPRGPRIH